MFGNMLVKGNCTTLCDFFHGMQFKTTLSITTWAFSHNPRFLDNMIGATKTTKAREAIDIGKGFLHGYRTLCDLPVILTNAVYSRNLYLALNAQRVSINEAVRGGNLVIRCEFKTDAIYESSGFLEKSFLLILARSVLAGYYTRFLILFKTVTSHWRFSQLCHAALASGLDGSFHEKRMASEKYKLHRLCLKKCTASLYL